jgi:hypothetical protein
VTFCLPDNQLTEMEVLPSDSAANDLLETNGHL